MKNKKGFLLISLGLLLVAAALVLAGYNLYDESRAARSAKQAVARLEELVSPETPPDEPAKPADDPVRDTQELEIPDHVLNPGMDMPVQTIDGQVYIGVLRIPALDLELPIISAWSYPRLKIAPCRYEGSAYLGNLVLAGHNYRSHFGSLKNLVPGDTVTFTDMDGNVFTYEVAVLETLQPTAVEDMTAGGWDRSGLLRKVNYL